jgi:hypothetical protein
MNKKLIIIVVVALVAAGGAYKSVLAKPEGRAQAEGRGRVYVLPKEFLVNLADDRFAKLHGGPRRSTTPRRSRPAATAPPTPPEGYGADAPGGVVRDIITNELTDATDRDLIDTRAARRSRSDPRAIKKHTDVHVEEVLFPTSPSSSNMPIPSTTSPSRHHDRPAAHRRGAELERLLRRPRRARGRDRPHAHDHPRDAALGPGSIVTLNRLAGEPVDLLVNGKPIARGEVVVIDEEFGLRVTEVLVAARAPRTPPRPRPGRPRGRPASRRTPAV